MEQKHKNLFFILGGVLLVGVLLAWQQKKAKKNSLVSTADTINFKQTDAKEGDTKVENGVTYSYDKVFDPNINGYQLVWQNVNSYEHYVAKGYGGIMPTKLL